MLVGKFRKMQNLADVKTAQIYQDLAKLDAEKHALN